MKKLTALFVLALVAAAAFAQAKPRLAILPFTGGSGQDGDSIANLFANSRELGQDFLIVPRTSGVVAIMKEQQFQRSGLTDTDTIADFGRQMNADYVVSGHITALKDTRLLLISIVHVETMRQVAGDYEEYARIEDIPDLLPPMAQKISRSVRGENAAPSRALAVLPLNIQDPAVEQADAEILAQILATAIANGHKYAVYPRTRTIEDVMKELSIQRSGLTDPESIVAIGRATNAQYVLAGTISKLGSMNLFDVKILEAETGGLVDGGGDYRRYTDLSDGIALMGELANAVTGTETARPPAPEPPYIPSAPRSTRNWFSRHDSNRPSLGINWGPMLTSGNGENEEGYRLGLDIAIVNMNAALPLVGKLFVEGGIDLGFGGEIYGRHNYEYDITKVKYFAYRPYGRLNIGIPLLEDDGFLFLLYAGVGFSYMNAAFEYNYSGYDSAETGTKTKTLEYSGLDLAFGFIMGARHHGGRVGFNLNTISDESYFHVQLIMGYIYRF